MISSRPLLDLTENSVLLIDALHSSEGLCFTNPVEVLECRSLSDVPDFLERIEDRRRDGYHLAGFLSYELGYAFEPKLAAKFQADDDTLLGWFGVFPAPRSIPLSEIREGLSAKPPSGKAFSMAAPPVFDMSREDYGKAFASVQEHLAQGDIYQVNLTMRARFQVQGKPEHLFAHLLERQPVAHAAWIRLADRAILSVSPELFLEREGATLRTRPMKGTERRGRTVSEDRKLARRLATDPKQRAENTMIVDLMRNDLSRISEPGSVRVTGLCDVEKYRSLHQMTSTVESRLLPGLEFPQIIRALFPCGSITGAPKLSAMTIAERLETGSRGVYTGSIGHIDPDGGFKFNVAIRTLVVGSDGDVEAGAGSGVIFDSGATPEYDECLLKLRFVTDEAPSFSLLETMAVDPDVGILLRQRHLRRLRASAGYFGIPLEMEKVEAVLQAATAKAKGPLRLRLLVALDGTPECQVSALETESDGMPWKVALATERTRDEDVFLYHKTTNRQFYDKTRQAYSDRYGVREVLFLNEAGFLTEGSFTNVFVQKDRRLLTPAGRHGLLPGTFREALLESGRTVEADLRSEDLVTADAIFVGNSVRGLKRVEVLPLEM